MKNLQLIEVKYLPVTNTLGARVKLIDHRLQEVVTLDRDYTLNTNVDQAIKYLESKEMNILGQGYINGHDTIICDAIDGTFQSIK